MEINFDITNVQSEMDSIISQAQEEVDRLDRIIDKAEDVSNAIDELEVLINE